MRFCPGAAALVLVLAGSAAAQSLSPSQRQLNIDSFEKVWTTVRDKHWDPKINGLDWQAIHDELRPKVEKATSMDQAREVMSDMLHRLKQTHFGIVPGDAYGELDTKSGAASAAEGGDGDPGIDLRIVDGHPLVTFVTPGSPAASAGVKTGWEILSIDGKEVAPGLEKVREAVGKSTLADLTQTRAVLARLEGPIGKPVAVEFLDGNDGKVSLQIARVGARGVETSFGNLPPLRFWIETRRIGDVGYVRFNMFMQPDAVESAVRKVVTECGDCRGMVIDLRGNPGGIGGMAMGLAGWFFDKSGTRLGTMSMRSTNINFVVFPRPEPFRGPLAILIDGNSASTSEIFAGGMQDLKRARIFGTRSAGAALPSMFERLPNGDGFQYAVANYVSQGGKPLEGLGVTPDEEVKLTRHQLLEGQDAVLDAAVSWIHKQKN